jgi:outer membrane protein OmpA-like peptidoglycan-associated protein
MPGGFGGTDIYVSYLAKGKWSKPQNLGPKINTFGNEMFPCITPGGDLYFASDGLPGFGSLDIFVTKKVNGEWIMPVNMGKDINSSYDDFALTFYKSTGSGLFCSNRPGGKGEDDIYLFKEIPPAPVVIPHYYVSGCVKDKNTREPVPGATIFLLNEKEGKVQILKTGNNGCFKTEITKGINYLAKAMQPGYVADCESFKFDESEEKTDLSIPRDLLLDKLAVNRKFKLENIYYDFDKWNIRPDAEPALDSLIKIMKVNNITVELGSHTDCRGSDEYNQKLSQRRAESAVQYIVSHGINPSRITAKGYGKSEPVNKYLDCSKCTEIQHQENRRTEIKVVSFEGKPEETFDQSKYSEGESFNISAFPEKFFRECK